MSLERLLHIEVPIIVLLGRRSMRVREVVGLCPGAIIELSKEADQPLDLLVNNQHIGKGSASKVGENFALRITEIGALPQRINALGGAPAPAAESAAMSEDDLDALAAQMLAGQ